MKKAVINTMDNRYIGAGQAAVIMAALGVFGLIISDFTDTGAMLSNAVSAVILITLALIPPVILIKDGSGSVPQIAVMRTGFIGRLISVLYSIFSFPQRRILSQNTPFSSPKDILKQAPQCAQFFSA